jgi:ABC-type Na+ efflux pump permease subunit
LDITDSNIEKIYISNDTDVKYDKEDVDATILKGSFDKEKGAPEVVDIKSSDLKSSIDSLDKNSCIVSIEKSEKGFTLKGIIGKESDIKPSDMDNLTSSLTSEFENTRLKQAGISEDDLKLIQKGIDKNGVITETSYNSRNKTGKTEKETSTGTNGYIMVIFFVSIMPCSYIISSLTEEKQSKLVESLLVSVRPMALVMGKILAMLCYVGMILGCGLLVSKLTVLFMKEVLNLNMDNYNGVGLDFKIFTEEGFIGVVILITSLLLAYIFFAMICGVLGSMCSKTEDTQTALGYVMIVVMIGYFASFYLSNSDSVSLTHVGALVPPLSCFLAPTMYLCKKIELWELLISFAIQFTAIALLIRVCAKTYKTFLLKNIDKVSLNEIVKALKNK